MEREIVGRDQIVLARLFGVDAKGVNHGLREDSPDVPHRVAPERQAFVRQAVVEWCLEKARANGVDRARKRRVPYGDLVGSDADYWAWRGWS